MVVAAVLVAATAAGTALVSGGGTAAVTTTTTTQAPVLEAATTTAAEVTTASTVDASTTYPEGAVGALPSGQVPTTRKGQPSRPINVPLGEWVCPMGGPFWHAVDWHAPRSGGRIHLGNDLIASEGIPVRSINDGYVAAVDRVDRFNGNEDLGGITITILTVAGDRFYYAHLATVEPIVVPGSPVNAGEVLGLVGDTGNAAYSVPHLHFEWRPGGGEHSDPYPLIETLCGPHPRSAYVPPVSIPGVPTTLPAQSTAAPSTTRR